MNIDFPPTFDSNYCRAIYPQLKNLPDDVLEKDFRNFAEENGFSTCIYDRREFLQALIQNIINQNSLKVLEIGPFDAPFFTGNSVKYFDVLDTEDLKKRAKVHNRHNNRTPEKIHYVEPNGDLKIVDEKFDIVFSSHCIEHQLDFVGHLQDVCKILNDDGLYIMMIPDKRYCFDHYRPDTVISEVLGSFIGKNSLRSRKSIFEYYCMTTHNDAIRHWRGDHGELKITADKIHQCKAIYEKCVNGGGIWIFILGALRRKFLKT